MKITEYAPYILGEVTTRQGLVEPYRLTTERFNEYFDIFAKSRTADQVMRVCESSKAFFYVEDTLKRYVSKEERDEFFFSIKNGFFYEGVPSISLYKILKAYNLYKLPNLIFKIFSKTACDVFFTDNHLSNDICWRDIICNVISDSYKPVTDVDVKVRYEDFSEVYIAADDMIAAIPNEIADSLSFEDIKGLHSECGSLRNANGQSLCAVGESYIACPTFDLRRIYSGV